MGVYTWAQFANYWSVNGSVFYNPAWNDTRITRGGPILRNPSAREFNLGFDSDSRKSWTIYGAGGSGWGTPGETYAWGEFGLTMKPSAALSISLGPNYTWQENLSQYVDAVDDPAMTATFGRRYIFADFEYQEISMSGRIDWSFTPRITLQSYVQPLIAVGDYRHIKEFAEPRTFDFNVYGRDGGSSIAYEDDANAYAIDPGDGGDAFTVADPDFNFKSIRVNMVLRWEYSPGSTLFVVWTRNGTNYDDPGTVDLSRDMRALLDAPSDDVVLLKITRWFDF
jgi:hypothetical protein